MNQYTKNSRALFEDVTLGGLQKRNRVLRKFIRNQLAPHREQAGVKTALMSPFEVNWPRINRNVQQMVMEKIKTALACMKSDVSRGGRKKRERDKEEEETGTGDDFTDSLRREVKNSKEKKRDEIRKCMVFGINETTRRLERDELSCLVVCSSTAAICPTNHLQILAATRQCPAMCIRDFSLNVGHSVGMNSMLVLAIKKSPPVPEVDWIQELVKVITANAIPIYVQWAKFEDEEQNESADISEVGKPNEDVKTDSKSAPTPTDPTTSSLPESEPVPDPPAKTETKTKPFDINSLYIKKADSNWLKDDTKIIPVIRGTKPIAAEDLIKFDPTPVADNPSLAPDGKEPVQKKRAVSVGYLPPIVRRVPRDENRKKSKEKKKKKN